MHSEIQKEPTNDTWQADMQINQTNKQTSRLINQSVKHSAILSHLP